MWNKELIGRLIYNIKRDFLSFNNILIVKEQVIKFNYSIYTEFNSKYLNLRISFVI